ncbi:Ail/Lom family outer membrane beta-barrel protein [Arsenophonus nasoniae]|uniref:Ail/Lom family outer membrane beta-barrel protein n=1 Tax=Arsenophonus nasoniae TaxID=638 RepID=A0AA95GLS5_9GAMM|nr:Ail/Lom family outer membrane beta-barrel protein [Arsenophonus nasoniae]WGL96551.1 Ail/Lom family outer membrane beta-barrel protein [Arsenophonus nasoniae]
MKKASILIISCLFSGAVVAKTGDQTLSFGYLNVNSNGVKDSVNLMRNDVRNASDVITNSFGFPATLSLDSYSNLGGAFMRYRYELTDDLGIISSLAYSTKDYNANASASKNKDKDRMSTKNKVSSDYISLMIGPTYRFNEYVSVYGLIGGAYKKVSYESISQEFKNNSLVNRSRNSQSDNKTELAYGVGMQVNFWQNATLDIGYEQSGSGEWKTNAFTIGIGYKF